MYNNMSISDYCYSNLFYIYSFSQFDYVLLYQNIYFPWQLTDKQCTREVLPFFLIEVYFNMFHHWKYPKHFQHFFKWHQNFEKINSSFQFWG